MNGDRLGGPTGAAERTAGSGPGRVFVAKQLFTAQQNLASWPKAERAGQAMGSSRTTTDFEVGVPLTSALESSGTSTFVSG